MTSMASGTRIWVPGAGGMLGQAVIARLRAAGQVPIGTGRDVDIAQASAVQAFAANVRPTHIINCAAYTQVDACETQVDAAMASNAAGPGHLATAAAAVGASLLHVSTDYVFDGTATTPYSEADPCTPLGAYGRSKRAGEINVWSALEAAGQASAGYVVRTAWLFGHGGNNFVQTMLRLFASREALGVVADQVGRPTFCDDLAGAIVALLGLVPGQPGPAPGGLYHFANAGAVSWHGFASAILQAARAAKRPLTCTHIRAIATAEYPTPARRPAYSVLRTDKIAAALGVAPRPWEQALEAYLADVWRASSHTQAAAQSAPL